MSSFHIRLADPAPRYTWADRKELEEIYSLPSAYNAFLGPICGGKGNRPPSLACWTGRNDFPFGKHRL